MLNTLLLVIYKFLLNTHSIRKRVRGKGFEPSYPLRDRISNLAYSASVHLKSCTFDCPAFLLPGFATPAVACE